MGRACISTLFLLLAIACPAAAAEDADRYAGLIADLGDDSVDVRWIARRTLRRAGEKAVPALIQGLANEDRYVRAASARILGVVTAGTDSAVDALVALSTDESDWVRKSAVQSLGWIGPAAARAVPALEKAVRDEDHSVRQAGIRALGEMGAAGAPALVRVLRERAFMYPDTPADALQKIGAPAVPALAEVLRVEKEDGWLRHTAALLLGKIGSPAKGATVELTEAMRDSDPRVALAAAFGFWRATGEEEPVVPLLLRGLEQDDPGIAGLAMWVASRMRCADAAVLKAVVARLDRRESPAEAGAVGTLREIGSPALPWLLEAMEKRSAPERRAHAEALVEIRPLVAEAVPFLIDALGYGSRFDGSPRLALQELGECAVEPLARALSRGDPEIRRGAAWVLGRLGETARAAVPALRASLKDEEVRVDAAAALVSVTPDATDLVPVLAKLARAGESWRRRDAVKALGRANPKEEALAELRSLLADEKSGVREAAAMAIWKRTGDPTAALPFLIDRLRRGDRQVQYDLGKVGRPAVAQILALLRDEEFDERYEAFHALGRIGAQAEEAVPSLVACLGDESDSIRCWSATALGSIGPAAKGAAPKLVELLLRDESRYVRRDAAEALPSIAPGDGDAEAALRKTLDSGTPDLRRTAALALFRLTGDAETAVPVIHDIVLDREATYQERREAVLDLAKIGPAEEDTLPTLLALLESREQFMAERAANAVAAVGGARPEVIRGLARLLDHREWIIRKAAVEALGTLGAGAEAVILEVGARTHDRNRYVRAAAREAAEKIRGD